MQQDPPAVRRATLSYRTVAPPNTAPPIRPNFHAALPSTAPEHQGSRAKTSTANRSVTTHRRLDFGARYRSRTNAVRESSNSTEMFTAGPRTDGAKVRSSNSVTQASPTTTVNRKFKKNGLFSCQPPHSVALVTTSAPVTNPAAALTPFVTAFEVTVAPVSASMSSPTETPPEVPRN